MNACLPIVILSSVLPVLVSAAPPDLRPISPPSEPAALPAEMQQLFDAMHDAAEKSARVFEPLSVEQMNFRPADGSHTPRWNVEHMAGRQLQFFSQLFNAVEPRIPVLDINPQQMPEKYEFAHPNWTGQQEADWIREVKKYCQRYAYLLSEIDLDAKPPAGRWPSLRKLLVTMESHYQQHTANVVKKFADSGWPQ